mmetsp:Transcript_15577/g.35913  ORF Transcript_15577/g.35913 Transcript_15577/m.35913 type:complete len:120 (+) Transcript_15577:159-518(+)
MKPPVILCRGNSKKDSLQACFERRIIMTINNKNSNSNSNNHGTITTTISCLTHQISSCRTVLLRDPKAKDELLGTLLCSQWDRSEHACRILIPLAGIEHRGFNERLGLIGTRYRTAAHL